MKAVLERAEKLDLKQATVSTVMVEDGRVAGVQTDIGLEIRARAVVITSGTFLRGLLHVGSSQKPGGRMADTSSSLSKSLEELGFEVGRFKTGTPCRISRRSIEFSRCDIQMGDEPPPRFSFWPIEPPGKDDIFTLNFNEAGKFHVEQVPCWITQTTPETHRIIRDNLHRSPLYAGQIKGTGPRYCPSIEDKVVKFSDRDAHQLFLEPEGRHTEEFYVNGISTSLPYDVQLAFVRSIPALEKAEIMRPGYAVEYDFFPPTQLHHTLETKRIAGLYFAGQVNGTSGYEEAAAQGLAAGANAALKIREAAPLVLDRSQSYMGVLIDDLVTKGTEEPYRMFTSRAEERLRLRQDNADQRLTALAAESGLIDSTRVATFERKMAAIAELRSTANSLKIGGTPVSRLLKRPDFTSRELSPEIESIASPEIWDLVETEIKYEGYAARQQEQNRKLGDRAAERIPDRLDFSKIAGLSSETRQKLAKVKPISLGQAARISGVTPADISILAIWLSKNALRNKSANFTSQMRC
jgi:tRNA uridine 5-carboxymethylaminomethyl modification enzyme